jgi:hypothetical protein
MKKSMKKLVLAKDTVKRLGEADLEFPQGGTLVPSAVGTICVCGSGYKPCFASEQYSCPC